MANRSQNHENTKFIMHEEIETRLFGKFQLNTPDMYLTTKNTKITKGKHIILWFASSYPSCPSW
jgi:hypothetical protein